MPTHTPAKFNGCMFSGFHHEVKERCDLGYHTVSSGNFMPTLWGNLSVPFSRVYIATFTDSMIIYKQYKQKQHNFTIF